MTNYKHYPSDRNSDILYLGGILLLHWMVVKIP